jgi:hypothetical protein
MGGAFMWHDLPCGKKRSIRLLEQFMSEFRGCTVECTLLPCIRSMYMKAGVSLRLVR